MEKEKVSIVVPYYNAEKYVRDCLTSILAQTYKRIQLIMVNDGSVDNSKKVVDSFRKRFEKKGIEFISLSKKNGGAASAMNVGLKYVTGEYLMWADSDDWYEYDAVESLLEYMKKKDLNFVRGNVVFRKDDEDKTIIKCGAPAGLTDKNIFNEYIFEKRAYCFTGIFMVKMEEFDRNIKNRLLYSSKAGQNWQLILPNAYKNECGYLDKVIYNYRVVLNSHSHSVKGLKNIFARCDGHKDILYHVLDEIDEIKGIKRMIYNIRIEFKYIKRKVKIALVLCKEKIWNRV